MTKRNAKNETAAQAYQRVRTDVDRLLQEVNEKLADHARCQAADPSNWGFHGDMVHYREVLEELLGKRRYYTTPMGPVTIPGREEDEQ
ncbi:MAG TPA: hypothetical protein VFA89_11500 [Terriglobales bacterium]|nr:hypothetical protein [Terriglobales bacterium]